MECVLMQIVLPNRTGDFHGQPVFEAQRIHPNQPNDFLQFALFLQLAHRRISLCHPVRCDMAVKPFAQPSLVKRITL